MRIKLNEWKFVKRRSEKNKQRRSKSLLAFLPTRMFAGQISELELRFAYEASGLRVWMEVDCRTGFHEMEAKREFVLEHVHLQDQSYVVQLLEEYITDSLKRPHLYTEPFSYKTHGYHGSGIGSMIGGLAVGLLGAMVLDEMIEEMFEDVAEEMGFDEESGLGDFFGGDGEEF
ncbi:sporulation protein [Ectobacillus antri]|uniref:sporulation protein n=1 Tax=Ectobacillus antri TaxID=2486280 RepID=UPI0013DE6F70|nr:sporulation protein [Ectobacillus antri]